MYRFIYESEMPVGRLVRIVADKNQVRQTAGQTAGLTASGWCHCTACRPLLGEV